MVSWLPFRSVIVFGVLLCLFRSLLHLLLSVNLFFAIFCLYFFAEQCVGSKASLGRAYLPFAIYSRTAVCLNRETNKQTSLLKCALGNQNTHILQGKDPLYIFCCSRTLHKPKWPISCQIKQYEAKPSYFLRVTNEINIQMAPGCLHRMRNLEHDRLSSHMLQNYSQVFENSTNSNSFPIS